MSVASTAPPRMRRRLWLLWLGLPVLLAALLGLWLAQGPGEPGKRTLFVMPGGAGSAASKAGGIKLELAPELRADNVQAELGAMFASVEQSLFLRHEVLQHEVFITPGNQPLRSSDLHFTLFNQAGAEISAGVLWPDVPLPPNVKTSLTIGDFELGHAVKIVLSKPGK
jgi:hypothetical protein